MSLITKLAFIDNQGGESTLNDNSLELHDYLTDNADWNNEFWDINPTYLAKYSSIILTYFNQSTNGITFQALWAGETPSKTITLSIDEFSNIILANHIGTKTKYLVRKYA